MALCPGTGRTARPDGSCPGCGRSDLASGSRLRPHKPKPVDRPAYFDERKGKWTAPLQHGALITLYRGRSVEEAKIKRQRRQLI